MRIRDRGELIIGEKEERKDYIRPAYITNTKAGQLPKRYFIK